MKKLLFSTACLILGLQASMAQLQNLNVGDDAPDFTVTDLHGTTHTLSDYAGKYILLDLFAHWCGPCKVTAPKINEFYKKYGCNAGDMIVLAFEADGTEAETQVFEDDFGGDENFPTPTISGLGGGGSDAVDAYGPAAYPTICLVDGDGKIASTDIWPVGNVGDLEAAVTAAGGSSVLVEQACEALSTPDIIGVQTVVYPNPAVNQLNVLSNTNGESTVALTDLLGRVVYTSSNEGKVNLSIDVSNFEAGHYVLSIQSGNKIEKQKITIK